MGLVTSTSTPQYTPYTFGLALLLCPGGRAAWTSIPNGLVPPLNAPLSPTASARRMPLSEQHAVLHVGAGPSVWTPHPTSCRPEAPLGGGIACPQGHALVHHRLPSPCAPSNHDLCTPTQTITKQAQQACKSWVLMGMCHLKVRAIKYIGSSVAMSLADISFAQAHQV